MSEWPESCTHNIRPPILCDICYPLVTGKTRDGGVGPSALQYVLNCELDGEPLGGVEYFCIEQDRDGKRCLMIFTDRTVAAHVSERAGQLVPLAVAQRPGRA